MSGKVYLWGLWTVLALTLSGVLGYELFVQEQKPNFLIGQTSHGHHQIEMACSTCHAEAFGGQEVLQNACTNCHAEELSVSQDSHPKSKFTDPRNADRLEKLDARFCVTCHQEHNEDITQAMGVTLPVDLCFNCHEDIAEDRASHAGMEFSSCASAGCHNYHDNRALYEAFLVANADTPWLKTEGRLFASGISAWMEASGHRPHAMPEEHLPPDVASADMSTHAQWALSAHAGNNVGCNTCHGTEQEWIASPGVELCATCHEPQSSTFMQGKHGMRLAQDLEPMRPARSIENHNTLAFNAESLERQLDCNTCHTSHTTNTVLAAVDSCLGCHADQHSLAYNDSAHGRLWRQFENGVLEKEQAVSCASCHMPVTGFANSAQHLVQHNQNDNLRPNEKMIRPVCMNCHSVGFSIDALADEALIENNFTGQPSTHIESIDMALKRVR